MKPASLKFQGKTPFSEIYGDVYFNTDAPCKESEFVFASAIDEIWDTQDRFIVGEAGFGAGLNFLTTASKFANSGKILHFVSIEANPVSREDLAKIYQNLGEFKTAANRLISLYPPIIEGIFRIKFAPNITLDLCFGEISRMLGELNFKADVWFLDGFAPAKNPQMWSEPVFREIARLTRPGGVARSYSCAKIVQENFAKAGFEVELTQGYGKKRQMSRAVLKEAPRDSANPWFARALNRTPKSGETRALIIGAGIAGLATACELASEGFAVTIADAADEVASNGSGNVCGALMPLITKPGVALGRMHLNAFLQAVNFYKSALTQEYINFSGCVEYAYDELLRRRYAGWEGAGADEIFSFDGGASPYPAILIKQGAYVRPKLACRELARNFDILLSHEYVGRERLENGRISVKFSLPRGGVKCVTTDILIFATGSRSTEIFGRDKMAISSVRGQVTHIRPLLQTPLPLSAQGYVCPSVDGVQVVGATYGRNEICDELRRSDDEENLSKAASFLDPARAEIIGGKVGYRSYSGDRFPIIGAMPDWEFYEKAYKNLFWSKRKEGNELAKYERGVFLNIAHGSRGLCTAVLGARLIADLILRRPLCIEKSLFNELHPARFLIRKLKRGRA